MACTNICLRDELLTSADTGGTWTLISGPAGNTVGSLLTSDNPCIDFVAQPAGQYIFEYSGGVGACGGSVQATLHNLDVGDLLDDGNQELCTSDAAVNITDFLTGTQGLDAVYTISGSVTSDAGYADQSTTDIFDDTFNPGAGGARTVTVVITCTPNTVGGSTLIDCCTPSVIQFDIVVLEGFDAGTGGTFSAC